ncbi:MAG: hypothetical protein LBS86_04980, partial [Treponema sp.]|nr:hypothetical protein [Treponema sp.]
MKNRIAIYSALALLIVSSGLFAQEAEPKPLAKEGLQFSGGMFTGVRVVSDSDMSTAQVWHDDVGNSWKLGILYETEVGGAKARLQWKRPDLWDNNGYTTWDNFAYGWVNMFGGLAVLSAGMIDDGLWGTGNVVDSTFDNVKGLRLEVKPMDGLSLGFAIPIILGDGSRDGDGYNKKYQLLALPFMNMDFGAKYGTDAFTVVFGLKLSGHDGDTTTWDKV